MLRCQFIRRYRQRDCGRRCGNRRAYFYRRYLRYVQSLQGNFQIGEKLWGLLRCNVLQWWWYIGRLRGRRFARHTVFQAL